MARATRGSRVESRAGAVAARPRSAVPRGSLGRLGRIGWMAGELALSGAAERARRLGSGGTAAELGSALLTGANGRRLARRLAHLRGAAMKLGQLLSLEGDDLLPADFAEALSVLRADGEGMPEVQLEAVMRDELGSGWRERFESFDPEPIAAASIGQVHRARARDGRDLAVKIQFPGIAESIESDIKSLVVALRLSRLLPADFDLRELSDEARRQLCQEADYELEARHLERYRELLADESECVVPRVHRELSTRRVLAMDYVGGVPLEELCGPDHGQHRRDRVAAFLYRLLLRELFELRFVQSDPNLANYLWLEGAERVGLIDLGAAQEVRREHARAYARMILAVMQGRSQPLHDFAEELGFVGPEEDAAQREGVVRLFELGCEAFGHRGAYDFGRSDLPLRLRETALDLAFRRGHRRPPPAATLFLHRKLAGTFLLCARLRARIDLRRMAEPLLEQAAA